MSILTERYVQAMQVSYPDQNDELIVPFDRLNDIVEIPLGFQPLGITNQPTGPGSPDKVIIADYFMPAFMLAEIWRNEHGLHFKTRRVNSVEVLPGITTRLFLGTPEFSDKDRGQTVIWASDNHLWMSRNGDRSFFVFMPAAGKDDKWKLISKFILPGHPHKDDLMIDSAAILKAKNKFYLHVVESEDTHGYWYNSCYESRDAKSWKWQNGRESVPWLYGVGISKPNNGVSCNQ